jgi:D-amino-acid dehydrogenase
MSAVESGSMKRIESDVLILGGGVVGLACAYHLLGAGRQVTIVDQGRVGGGSSHGNCGTLTPSHAMPLAMPGVVGTAIRWLLRRDAPLRIKPRLDPALLRWLAAFRSRCNWEDFSSATALKAPLLVRSAELIGEMVKREQLDCEYQNLGSLHVFRDQKALAGSSWYPRTLEQFGIPVERLDGERIESMEPALKTGVVGGYFNAGDAQLRPDRYVAELARLVRERGGLIDEHTCIDGIDVERGRITRVRTTAADYVPGEVVFALGAWSPALARPMGLRLPIQPGKGYSITYSRPEVCPQTPMTLKEASVCVTAWNSGYRLGSTMEFAGYDSSLNRTRLDALRRSAAQYLREPEGPLMQEEWYGWRPMTPDDLPILGRVPGIGNLCMATGHGMLGVTLSAVTGLLVSELLVEGRASMDLEPFSIARFN